MSRHSHRIPGSREFCVPNNYFLTLIVDDGRMIFPAVPAKTISEYFELFLRVGPEQLHSDDILFSPAHCRFV